MAAAAKETELEDFGDQGFVEPFERYLAAVVTEARLSAAGVIGTQSIGANEHMLVEHLRAIDHLIGQSSVAVPGLARER